MSGDSGPADGLTALHSAILSNELDHARGFLEAGADVDAPSHVGTPLHAALTIGLGARNDSEREIQEEIITLLLDHRANVNALDEWGDSTLNLAVTGGDLKFSVETARKLIEHGADVNAKNSFSLTPLHNVYVGLDESEAPESRAPLVALLLASGADVHARCMDGETPLSYALTDPESVKLLLDAGARIDVKNERGKTPLDAAREKSPAAAELLSVRIGK